MRRSERNHTALYGLALLAVGTLAVSPRAASAATLYVGNNGNDAAFPGCGAKTSPCRSIGKGIAIAAAGDTIMVGPGVYGDLNQNGTFEPASGEEAAEIGSGCECMIKVDKPLTFKSRDGARVTVLDAAGLTQSVVHILAPAADATAFGKPSKGFTIRNGATDGLLNDATAIKVKVQGNIANGNGSYGFRISGAGGGPNSVKVMDNIARSNGTGFKLAGTSNFMQRNRAVRNGVGFDISGATHVVTQDVATQNSVIGFVIGIAGSPGPLSNFSSNAAISNALGGIQVFASNALNSNLTIKKSSIYGNDDSGSNCGLLINNVDGVNTLNVTATGNFWGASTGAGSNPADAVCSTGSVAAATGSPHAKEFAVGEAALK